MTKAIKESADNIITLDKTLINESILSTGEFSSDGIYIKKYTPRRFDENNNVEEIKKDSNKYITTLKKDGAEYYGMLNNIFQKEGYGLEKYTNNDKYFGQYDSDMRNDNGIYFFKNEKNEENNNIKSECYIGQWKNNLKDKYGVYLWIDEPENNFEFEKSNFDVYIGEFDEEKFIRGSYLTKKNEEFLVYHGNFDKGGKKSDNNAYFYSSKLNKVFHGEIKEDILLNGYLANFDEEKDEIIELYFCEFNGDGSVKEIVEEKYLKLNEEEILDEKKKIKNFRNILLEGDYFKKIYSKYKKIKDKVEKLDDLTQILENEETLGEIDKILNKFNKNNIYYNIEENFFGRDI